MSGPEIGFGAHTSERRETSPVDFEGSSSSFSSDSVASPSTSPFMCTPQSFPPTPHSRSMVMARGSRFADDVVYLARDRLRLHAGGDSLNEKTRGMAKLLREGKRLAVFNANELSSGVELSWYGSRSTTFLIREPYFLTLSCPFVVVFILQRKLGTCFTQAHGVWFRCLGIGK